ncbi:MAG: beta strand repeat-containing protein, partial [Thainema sp.]
GTIEVVDNDNDGEAAFIVNANNEIVVNDADELDFETTQSYTLDVTITDAGGLSDTEAVTITVTNVEEPPEITPGQEFTIPEDSVDGDEVGTVEAVDSDGDIVTWAILTGNVDTDNDGELLFEIDSSGNITVNDGDELDFETTSFYDLGVRVIDGQGNTDDEIVTVNIDNVNEPPTVDPDQTFTVPENSPIGFEVGFVTATDLEGNLSGFQIVGGNPDNDDDGTFAFSISNTGRLFVTDPGDLNFEDFPTDYTLTIQATDAEGASSTGTITVSVTDENEPPFIAPNQTFNVDEGSPQGTVFGTVNGGDPDTDPANQIANWEIVAATNPDNDTDGIPAFEISPTGELSVLDPDELNVEEYPTEYTLTVRAVDGQGDFSTRDITVTVNDVNEAPVVDPGQAFTVDENAANGTVVGDITFSDPDANDTFTGSIAVVDADGDGTPAFSVQNGQIVVTDGDEIDFETNPTYTLNVTVTDAGGLSSSAASVTIGVNDVNEAPVITTVDPVFNIDEGQPVGAPVGTIEFTDPDAPPNEVKTVTINSPDGDGDGTPLFAIDLNGNITVNDADELDFELFPITYTLEVEVSDGELSDTTTVTITVNDANELPVIDPGQVFTVAETAPNGTAFGTVAATDDDGTLIGWTIVGGNPDNDGDGVAAFRINSATGALVVNDRGDLDQEAAGAVASYDLTVQVGDGIGTSQEVITVNIEDIDPLNDDFASAIQLAGVTDSDTGSNVDATAETGEPTLSIPNNSVWWTWTAPASGLVIVDTFGSSFDTLLGVYTGTTVDALTEVAFNDDATGSVQSEVQFVAVQGATYYFLVDGFQAQAGDVQINLNFDANEPPVIAPGQSFAVPENSPPGTVVGTVAASDADGTIDSWAITDGNTDLDGDGTPTFSISDTGQIIVEDGDGLDFESKTVFELEITATDNLGEATTQVVGVTISNVNEPPTVTPGLAFDVSEAAANGTVVGTVTATDPDGNADVVAWTISDADNPDLDGDGTRAFAISNTGVITVADTDDIDFEAAAPITQLTVTATDAGGLSSTEVIGITVTNADEAPVIDPGQAFEIDENIADTTAVGTVTAIDPENDITTWAISDASNPDLDGDGTRAFAIDATGQITVADTDDIDFTVADTITLEVTATDATNLSDTESVVININDTNQAPDILDGQVFDVLENSATGTTVGTVDVDDSDGNLVNWEITSGNPDTDGDGSPGFTINSEGVITVLDGDELDFETAQSYDLEVTVIDSFNASDTATVTVQIQDDNESPTIQAGQTFSIDEGAALSTSIGSVVATDPDADDSLTWAITSGNINPDGDGAAAFGINPTTGELFVTDGNDIDASTNASVNLTIQVTDEAGNTDSETVVINVNDINEPPVIPSGQQFTVGENAANGAEIGTVADEDPEGNVTAWSIVSGNPDNDTDGNAAFAIDNTGLLTVADADDLDAESFPGPYTVRVQANDGEFTIQQDITINIQDENDPPVVDPDQTFEINEGSPNGTAVGTVTATDPEGSIAGWAITAGNPDNDNDGTAAFAINTAGQITVADSNEINFENLNSYSLTVRATDNAGATNTGTVGITVNDVDEAPRNLQLQAIPNTSTNFTVNLAGSFVDPDQGDPHTATIQWGDGTAPTTLNLAAGNTSINGSHVYTTPGNFTVSVTVADAAGQVQSTQSVQVGNSAFPDFNRDNSPGVAWRNISTGQNSLWFLGDNNTRIGGGAPPAVAGASWRIEGIGDYDGDGQDDLVWRNSATGQNSVWFMNGTSRIATAALNPVTEAGWQLQGVGTFQANSARRDDLVWRNQVTGQNSIWIMNGATRTGFVSIDPVTDTNWEIAGVGNFDGDGRLDDVVWRNYATGQNVVWFINADGTKSTQALPILADTTWRIEGVSDFDGDGRANDLLWQNRNTGQTTTWFIGNDFTRQGVQALNPQVNDANWKVVV